MRKRPSLSCVLKRDYCDAGLHIADNGQRSSGRPQQEVLVGSAFEGRQTPHRVCGVSGRPEASELKRDQRTTAQQPVMESQSNTTRVFELLHSSAWRMGFEEARMIGARARAQTPVVQTDYTHFGTHPPAYGENSVVFL